MRVNLHATTFFDEHRGKTDFEVEIYVHDEVRLVGHASLYKALEFAQQPDENMNLNLWATALLRGLVARMEETFVYVDERPPAVLMQNAIDNKKT